MPREWHTTADGKQCRWCGGSEYEPADDTEAFDVLCRGHYAEYAGESLAGLDRRESAEHADIADLGYFD